MALDSMNTALCAILNRAIALVDAESAALRRAEPADHMAIATHKTMILFELSKLVSALPRASLDQKALRRIEQLRAKLSVNRSLLEVHIAAASEIVGILTAISRAADSDGTYSMPFATGRRPS